MTSDKDKFKKAIRNSFTPPNTIEADVKVHDFISVNGTSSYRDKCEYIFYEGNPSIGLFSCKSRGISRKWSSKKIEEMTSKEQCKYEAKLNDMRALLKKEEAAVDNAHSNIRQAAIVKALLMEEPEQKKNTAQKAPASRQRTHAKSRWNDQNILNDRVARRFLLECIEVIGDRSAIKTLKLVALLNSNEQMPWYVYNTGKPIGNYHLSHLLGKFDIRSEALPFKGNVKAKGFRTELFRKALRRVQKLQTSKTTKVKK